MYLELTGIDQLCPVLGNFRRRFVVGLKYYLKRYCSCGFFHNAKSDLIELCSLCLRSTVFTFRDKLYVQTEGLPMGSPLSPVVANIFIKKFENIAITRFRRPPKIHSLYYQSTQHAVYICNISTNI